MPAISALTDPTVLDFVTGEVLTAAKLESDSGNLRTAIVDLNDVVADLEDNYASSSEPTDKPEGKIFCDTTNDPAQLKFYKDGSGTLDTLTSLDADNVFTGATTLAALAAAGWPSFMAHRNNSTQNNITSVDQIEFDNDSTSPAFDTNSDYDTTNFRFLPTVAGTYLLIAHINWETVVDGDELRLFIKKKTSIIVQSNQFQYSGTLTRQTCSIIMDADGATDYFEVFAQNAARDTSDITGTIGLSYFCGSRIA